MKYLRGILIIFAISFCSDCLKYFIPLPVPASIYGLVLMFVLLWSGIVPLESVEAPASFLIGIMPVLFVPAGVGLMASWGSIREMLMPALVIVVGSMVLIMTVAGKTADWLVAASLRAAGEGVDRPGEEGGAADGPGETWKTGGCVIAAGEEK